MSNQNYQNHRRMHPLFHIVLTLVTLATLIGILTFVIRDGMSFTALLFMLVFVYMAVVFLIVRAYPLKAQDRAIRAEENLRHYVLTGKLLDPKLTIRQITALRFANDEEFPELCRKAAAQNTTPDEIKKSIRNWRGDYYRI